MDASGTDAVSEIKSRLNVEDVVSQYIQLKRAGRNFKGLSPFTNEKTPSLMVSPEKQIWHDFSSGKGGDILTFVMEVEGLDFRAALELLARQAGVELEQFKGRSGAGKLKNRLLEVLDAAASYYQAELRNSQPALRYLVRKRHFGKKTILDWRLGYSPNLNRGLTDTLVKKGFSLTEIKRAGLAVERRGQTVDMFRNRMMIPLCDAQGSVVGFTARLLTDDPSAPKYINTPATAVYDKSRQIFGLHMAKESVRKSSFVVVAEGNLDVISSHQAGVANVVASAGTAMTQQHLLTLKRFTSDIRLSFDSDRAGVAAAERVIPLAQKAGVELKIINMPEGTKDPDELVQKDVKLWQKVIKSSQYAIDWLIETYKSQLDLAAASGKKKFSDILLATIKQLSDPVEQEHYLKLVAKLTDTSVEAMRAKMGQTTARTEIRLKKPARPAAAVDRSEAEYQKLQLNLLSAAYFEPAVRWLLKDLPKEIFSSDEARQSVEYIKSAALEPIPAKLPARLKNLESYVKILEIQFEELYQDIDVEERVRQASLTRNRLADIYVKSQRSVLVEKMQGKTGKELERLISRADNLNKLIKLVG